MVSLGLQWLCWFSQGYYSTLSSLWRGENWHQSTKSCEPVLGIAQIFRVAVSFRPLCPSSPATQKSGQNTVLPGWGERTYLEGCCFATAAVIRLPCRGRSSRTVRRTFTFAPTTIIAQMNVPRLTSTTTRCFLRMALSSCGHWPET